MISTSGSGLLHAIEWTYPTLLAAFSAAPEEERWKYRFVTRETKEEEDVGLTIDHEMTTQQQQQQAGVSQENRLVYIDLAKFATSAFIKNTVLKSHSLDMLFNVSVVW